MQFDTTQNHFLAVGEDSQIKFWDMDNVNILTYTDAEGGLPVSIFCIVSFISHVYSTILVIDELSCVLVQSLPRLRFNKEGNLLAVTTDNGFKILANAVGMRSLKAIESTTPFEALRSPMESALKVHTYVYSVVIIGLFFI